MQEFSKYRMITAGFILMFIFVVAAIYTNTKDVAAKKMNAAQTETINNNPSVVAEQGNNIEYSGDFTTQNANNNETDTKILQITDRLDELERKVFAPENNETDKSVKCMVQGILNDGHIIPLSAQEAVNESRTNGKEVLITCVFK